MEIVHGGDENILRERVESLRVKYSGMRMKEDENVVKYVSRIKEFVSVIKAIGGVINDTRFVNKVLITLLPIYAIKFYAIQEVGAMLGNALILDGLVGHLIAF